ncbi:transposase [Streptomyces umbrinus]|uniref:Transposase n=1 Tax=Streptomyces umbrinus TaxID=67370 RepID=A0ABU0T796_9ACTN|nr:IS110 family transposase [Streptomyces umbrinus]MDQ1031679.1 transposase [Streptomyces umbrinus]
MKIFCGIDWAEDHHDVALVNERGDLVAKQRITDDLAGLETLQQLLAEAGDGPEDPIPVAIETSRGLLVACLRATGRPVYAINPMAVARYRERRSVARAKSDHADALALANVLRTDADHHRPLPADSELIQAIAVLARAQQDAVWNRQQLANQLRSLLREFFPSALAAFQVKNVGLAHPEARAVLAAAPTPAAAAALSKARLRSLLRKAGRQRRIETRAEHLAGVLREPHMRQLPRVEEALGQQVRALVLQLDAAAQAADDLAAACAERFTEHDDAEIITSFPGLGELTGARILAEIGDDRSRFTDGRALKAYAGSAPITRASGKSLIVHHRKVKNQRLAAVGYVWSFAALSGSRGARGHYDRRRRIGDRHTAALRNLFNRLLGQLHHCLITRQNYDENTAFPTPLPVPA